MLIMVKDYNNYSKKKVKDIIEQDNIGVNYQNIYFKEIYQEEVNIVRVQY